MRNLMNPAASDFVAVLVTAGSAEEAERIAAALVAERLAACVNITAPILSVYRWQGEVQREQEWLLVIKTRAQLFESLAARVRALHSYETPEVIALPLVAGSPEYLRWLEESTQ